MTKGAPGRFDHFIGIDWSGARGRRHPGLSVARCGPDGAAPALVGPPDGGAHWSRKQVMAWLGDLAANPRGSRTLVGIDSAFAFPARGRGFGPGLEDVCDPRALWAHVDACGPDGADLYGGGFVARHRDLFFMADGPGARFQRRLRVAEHVCNGLGRGRCESVFHLVGPSQVGLSALSTMRMLNRLAAGQGIAVWPFDPPDQAPLVLAEVFASYFVAAGGGRGKVRGRGGLAAVLAALGSAPHAAAGDLTDHDVDALAIAAGLRHAVSDPALWRAPATVPEASREGWVFGVSSNEEQPS
ncbi:hypothetical protein [Yunchengibacter salinarum]|uniref:hypothetical protein n=1 Tax=Yunchengibacter salinarum TaxID=3133399 RepID=UPI0035B5B14E